MKQLLLFLLAGLIMQTTALAGKDGDGEFSQPWSYGDPYFVPSLKFHSLSGNDRPRDVFILDFWSSSDESQGLSKCEETNNHWVYRMDNSVQKANYFLFVFPSEILFALEPWDWNKIGDPCKIARSNIKKKFQQAYRMNRREFEQRLRNVVEMIVDRTNLLLSQLDLSLATYPSPLIRDNYLKDYVGQNISLERDIFEGHTNSFTGVLNLSRILDLIRTSPIFRLNQLGQHIDTVNLDRLQYHQNFAEALDLNEMLDDRYNYSRVLQLDRQANRYIRSSAEWMGLKKQIQEAFPLELRQLVLKREFPHEVKKTEGGSKYIASVSSGDINIKYIELTRIYDTYIAEAK